MQTLNELLDALKYTQSLYYRRDEQQFEPETAHLFRSARAAGVDGMYVYRTSPGANAAPLACRPVVLVAQADSEQHARQIHKSIWNLGIAPFLLIVLPHQIRVYTGFDYAESNNGKERGLLGYSPLDREHLRDLLAWFSAEAINTGKIWESDYAAQIDLQQRVDTHLLNSLQKLEKVLCRDKTLPIKTIHALIGKYVYIRYLWDRNILTARWLQKQGIAIEEVLERNATVQGLARLVHVLEKRFNGKIFPLAFEGRDAPQDEHVSMTASVFKGDVLEAHDDKVIQQLHLAFQAYDFSYIPVETLSAVYEQFIGERYAKGAYYTPELLADYLLSEVHAVKPLQAGMQILDPACGSGVFLVLAYRRLIEQERAKKPDNKLSPEELKTLLNGIYGVEKETDACYVTEFSLVLTLLHYIDPPELEKHPNFLFPDLHNTHIFECDFFDDSSFFWQQQLSFDWIVGNPPWIKASSKNKEQSHAYAWIKQHKNKRPVGRQSIAEAFSWRVMDVLHAEGVVGLLLPATSLVNIESQPYREQFFLNHEVRRITNFANLRQVLFKAQKREEGAEMPAATLVYQNPTATLRKPDIIHCSPLSINQHRPSGKKELLTITIYENDIRLIPVYEAEQGETSTWKYALWGTHRDKRAIERLQYMFPTTLEQFCEQKGWGTKLPRQGAELCDDPEKPIAHVKGLKYFNSEMFNDLKPAYHFSIPSNVLLEIPHDAHIRRGEEALRMTTNAPHIIISKGWDFVLYSEEDFIIPPQQMGIVGTEEDTDYLRTLALYLSSSLVRYYLFFHVPEWGFYRQRESVVTTEVRKIPTPTFTPEQAQKLAALHKEIAHTEEREIKYTHAVDELHAHLQQRIDDAIFETFHIPNDIATLVTEFIDVRLLLDGSKEALQRITQPPTQEALLAYAHELRDELDGFVVDDTRHAVTMTWSKELIECAVELTKGTAPIAITEESVVKGDVTIANVLQELQENTNQQFSQWVYVQRGLRLFDGPRILLYKPPRLIDWTRTQAMNDATDIIGQAIVAGMGSDDNNRN